MLLIYHLSFGGACDSELSGLPPSNTGNKWHQGKIFRILPTNVCFLTYPSQHVLHIYSQKNWEGCWFHSSGHVTLIFLITTANFMNELQSWFNCAGFNPIHHGCPRHILLFVVGVSGILRKWNFQRTTKIYQGFWII